MKTTHKIAFTIYFAAFCVFVANEFMVLSGLPPLDLSGLVGGAVLTFFFTVGFIVQLGKMIEGHSGRLDAVFTLLMLPAHVIAALSIWFTTEIGKMGLPAELPLYFVGLYWVIGFVEIMARYLPRELRLFKSDYVPPEQQLIALRQDYAVLQAEIGVKQREREDRREQRQASKTASLPASTSSVKADERKERVYSLMTNNPGIGVTDIQRQIGVKSRGTVYNDLNDLVGEGRAVKEGDKYRVLTNGNGHN